MTNQAAGENPLKVFGAMLAYYRNRIGMTPEQLGARVYLSGSQIRKVEAGNRTPSQDLAKACEAIPELGCNGALTELYEILSVHLKRRAYPGWFAGWPDKEAQARRLRSFEPLVVRKSLCFSLRAFDAGEDLVGVLGPGKGPRMVVPVVDECADGVGQLAD